MNFIAYNAAYSLYPRATFDRRVGIPFAWEASSAGLSSPVTPDRNKPIRREAAYSKYTDRGWTFVRDMSRKSMDSISAVIAPGVVRFLDDRFTWVVPLGTDGLDLEEPIFPCTPEKDPFIVNSWILWDWYPSGVEGLEDRYESPRPRGARLGISYRVYQSVDYLRDTYLVADENLRVGVDNLVADARRYVHGSGKKGNSSWYVISLCFRKPS